MKSQKIRRSFLDYFKKKGHTIVPSSPVLPHDDPTLLFVNAGMNQFKDLFLGKSKRDYTRAATAQKCIRVGGKHNDLENVGHTSRHLTFFEMLGNFSFGDYFKKEAIDFGFDLATSVLELDVKQIFATVFFEDEEAFELWKRYLPEERIIRMGEKDNFWAMGDTGPCGPCSELLFDRGPQFGKARNPAEDITGERFFEFWNLVFMQYNRNPAGDLEPLPKKSVDTGAGLERLALLKDGAKTVFETDILRAIITEAESYFGITYSPEGKEAPAFHVIADHLRSLSFAIADGVQPSNIERGYVLRKVLRRAVRYGRQLGAEKPFLAKLLPRLVSTMGEDYPELITAEGRIGEIITQEEENFLRTLQRGGNILNQIIARSADHGNQISGEDAFKLKDTYGMPLEEILLLAKDANLSVDIVRFEGLEKEAKERSRSLRKEGGQELVDSLYTSLLEKFGPTTFVGYEEATIEASVLAIIKQGKEVDALYEGEEGALLLDTSCFYAEKGGQVGDQGAITSENLFFSVFECNSPISSLIFHHGIVKKASIRVGNRVVATIDTKRRQKIANNHTATHLLHFALHEILGPHVRQAGSIVEPHRLRFDFSHHKAITREELHQIEDLVNQKIRGNEDVRVYEMPFEEVTQQRDIKQFFGEKYGSVVRVIDIDYSKELCGGTHTHATGNIGYFKITENSSIAAGVRRIEAVTGEEAELLARKAEEKLLSLGTLLKVQEGQVVDKISTLLAEKESQLDEIKKLRKEFLAIERDALVQKIEKRGEMNFLVHELSLSAKELKDLSDLLLEKSKSLGLFLVTHQGSLFVRLSPDIVKSGLRADAWLKEIASAMGGKGGGSAEMAQGSLSPEKISSALVAARSWIQTRS